MHTSHKTQNATILRNAIKAASFFTIVVLGLFILPPRAAGQNGVAVIGPNTNSTPYGCNTVGTTGNIIQAIADANSHEHGITQSVVDASNCTSLTITQEIDIGTGSIALNTRIKFILPANGLWTANITDGTSYALKWGDGTMIYGGTGSGEGQPFIIKGGAGSNLKAVCGNDPTIHGEYFHAEGFTCAVDATATVQDAIIEISSDTVHTSFAGPADESYVGHVSAYVNPGGATVPKVIWVHGACCSATFEDINADAAGNSGTVPCVFGNGGNGEKNIGIHASKFSCVHPGAGQNAVQIQQTGANSNLALGNSFRDFYMEEGGSDTTTAFVAVTEANGTFPPADLLDGFRAGNDATGSTRYMVDIGSGGRVNISNLGLGYVSNRAINDHVNNVSMIGTVNQTITSYDMAPRYRLLLGAVTVSSLPPAATNAGAMFSVSDAMNAGEGQPCTAGGTQTALAFSNGSVWKCF